MNNDELNKLVELYFDGELDKHKEPALFSALSADPDSREYFRKLHALREAVSDSTLPFPIELEENIFTSLKFGDRKPYGNFSNRERLTQFISIAAAAVLLIICSILFFEIKDYKTQVQSITEEVKGQKETIDALLNNSYPAVVVSPESKNEIIVKANSRRRI
jgi:hypothetical protein